MNSESKKIGFDNFLHHSYRSVAYTHAQTYVRTF